MGYICLIFRSQVFCTIAGLIQQHIKTQRIYRTQNYSNSTEQNKYQPFAPKVTTLIIGMRFFNTNSNKNIAVSENWLILNGGILHALSFLMKNQQTLGETVEPFYEALREPAEDCNEDYTLSCNVFMPDMFDNETQC